MQQNIDRTVIPKGSYLSELLTTSHFRKSTVTNLVASTGSGKMFAIAEIQKRIAERVIYVSPLVRLVEQAKQDLRAVGYTDGVKRDLCFLGAGVSENIVFSWEASGVIFSSSR